MKVDRTNAALSDKVIVTGTADLAGTVHHLHTGGTAADYQSGNQWIILEAGTVNGAFDDVISNLAFLQPTLGYIGNNVVLSFITPNPNTFAAHGRTYNQRSVSAALGSLTPGSPLYNAILITTKAQAERLLDSLSGELHSTLFNNLLLLDKTFTRDLSRHISKVSLYRNPDLQRFLTPAAGDDSSSGSGLLLSNGVWASVGGSHSRIDGDGNAAKSTLNGPDVSVGYDARLADGWLAGMAMRYSFKELDINARRSDADIHSFTVGLYGGKEFDLGPGTMRLTATGAYTRHEVESSRTTSPGGIKQNLEADYGANSWQAALEAAWLVPVSESLFLEPFARVGLDHLRINGFSETGGNAALRKKTEKDTQVASVLGLRATLPLHEIVDLDAEVGWQHTYGSLRPESDFVFREGSDIFTIRGNSASRDEALVNLGLNFKVTDNFRIKIGGDAAIGDNSEHYGGAATFIIEW